MKHGAEGQKGSQQHVCCESAFRDFMQPFYSVPLLFLSVSVDNPTVTLLVQAYNLVTNVGALLCLAVCTQALSSILPLFPI